MYMLSLENTYIEPNSDSLVDAKRTILPHSECSISVAGDSLR